MSQQVLLKLKGLYTFPNELSEIPSGALSQADNVIINRESVVEPRRGFKIYGDSMGASATVDVAHQFLIYKNRILRHFGTGSGTTLQYDNGSGTFTSFTGTYAETQQGLRIKGQEVNGNLYFTTSNGIKKLSSASAAAISASSITNSGGIKALDTELSLNSQPGFFTQDSIVAYRIVWGIKDPSNNLILGTPSERVVISNPIKDLLIENFNDLLVQLDTVNNSGGINDQDYVSTLKVAANDTTDTLRTNIIALATKLDNDTVITEGAIDVSTSQRTGLGAASIVFSADVSTFLQIGDQLICSGFNNSEFNSRTFTITNVATTTVTASVTTGGNFTGTDGAPIAEAPGTTVERKKYTTITEPVALSDLPTTTQLESLQDYYDEIVTRLQLEPIGIVTDTTIFDGSFSTTSATVDLNFTIPQGITTSYFYQVYRTALTTSTGASVLSDLDPGDEMGLVLEDNPTSSQITAGFVTVQDITPEAFRGANLYTNPNSGEGILQSNELPPLSKDLALYKNSLFYADTQTRYRKQFSLLSVSDLVSGSSTVTVTDGSTSNVYTFVSPEAEVTTVETVADVAGSLNNTYFTLNSAKNETQYYIWYNVGGAGVDPAISGKTGIEIEITANETADNVALFTTNAINELNDFMASVITDTITITNTADGIATDAANGATSPGFTITVTTQGAGEDVTNKKILLSNAETVSQQVDETARSLIKVINRNSAEIVYGFYLSGPDDVPGLLLLESRSLGTNPFYLTANNTDTGEQFSPTIPTSGSTFIADNEASPNRVYYSKFQQPEAVPLLNWFDIGPKDKRILRILALRDSLFVLKEEGVYRISGEFGSFVVTLFDSSTILKAPDTAVVLNNQIYMLSDQGIVTISDTGISIISRPIENEITKLNTPNYSSFSKASFGVGYESDRAFYLWTVTDTADTKATQCFRYNIFTQSWTRFPITKTCGIINPADDKLYLGAGDTNFIEQERKSFNRTDYCDREHDFTLASDAIDETEVSISSAANIDERDVVVQIQYLTIYQFNKLLLKLDTDYTINDSDYYSSLAALPGNSLRDKLTALATKLDADSGVADNNYASTISGYGSTFTDIQDAFNVIVNKLNADSGVTYTNFMESSGTTTYEVIVTDVNRASNTFTIQYEYPLIAGPIKIYKGFSSSVEWAPQYFGDVSVMKQIRESTLIFERNTFSEATVSFATDLNPGFESIEFNGSGNGIFGSNMFGNETFGGFGSAIPFRTYVPRNKQRCRYISCKFQHGTARESFSLFGMSLTGNLVSERAYK